MKPLKKLFSPKPPDSHLRVAKEHVEFLNSIPEFRDLSTTQLWFALPEKYRKHVPPINAKDDLQTRASIIGMLAHPTQIESHLGTLFLERL
jgi:hypothetical protein